MYAAASEKSDDGVGHRQFSSASISTSGSADTNAQHGETPSIMQTSTDTQLSSATSSSTGSESKDKPYVCRFCGLSYTFLNTLKAHERVHDVEEPFKCAKCGFAFRFNSELQAHNMEHTREGKNLYKCQCGRAFVNYSDLLWHKHPGEDDEVDALAESSSGSGAARSGYDHGREPEHSLHYFRSASDRGKAYMCQFCRKAYSNSSDLKSHMYGHRGEQAFQNTYRSSRYLRTPI